MSEKALKYHAELKESACTLADYKEHARRIAYRWVFEDTADSRNFLPIYAIDNEKLEKHKADGEFSCTCWALSFFKSEIQAKEKFDKILSKNPRIHRKLGTHIAKGYLNATDGISGECDEIGHFNHFEYEEAELVSKFSVKSCLLALQHG
jgi:hypothetical protein